MSETDKQEKINILKDKTLFTRLVKEAKPVWYLFAISLVAILILTYAKALRPKIISNAIDTYIEPFLKGNIAKDIAKLGIKNAAKFLLMLLVIELGFSCVRNFILTYAGRKIIYNLRLKLFKHVQKLPLSYFDKTPVGTIVTRVTNDPSALNEMFSSILVGFSQNIFFMMFLLYMLFTSDIRLTVISILLMPLIVVITSIFRLKARKIFRKARAKLAAINAYLSEHITGVRIIKSFHMQEKKIEAFDDINKEFYQANMSQVVIMGIFRPLINIIKYLTIAILLWFAGIRYMNGAIEIGILYLFISYIGELFQPLIELADQFNTLQSSFAAGEKIYTLLDMDVEPDTDNKFKFEDIKGEISFKNVWFAYNDEEWVLKDISFTIKPGENVAFVGHTGAGKTTIISLICGFYEIQKGSITIDGVDIKTIRKKEFRRNIGLVLQDVYLTSGDIYSNIKLNDPEISNERVLEITRYLQADTFINELDGGFNHKINQGGTVLSTGQRQLISFARALVYDPKILVMDEATSNIDTQTEELLQNALKLLMKDRTTISIAHRLSTIQQSDNIIVMHHGEIRETGNHQDLLNQGGLYYQLYKLQYNSKI
jgi:ATP-binding cassette subfamily B multidrug efflux pump